MCFVCISILKRCVFGVLCAYMYLKMIRLNTDCKYFTTYSMSLSYQVKPMTHFIVKVILQGRELLQ